MMVIRKRRLIQCVLSSSNSINLQKWFYFPLTKNAYSLEPILFIYVHTSIFIQRYLDVSCFFVHIPITIVIEHYLIKIVHSTLWQLSLEGRYGWSQPLWGSLVSPTPPPEALMLILERSQWQVICQARVFLVLVKNFRLFWLLQYFYFSWCITKNNPFLVSNLPKLNWTWWVDKKSGKTTLVFCWNFYFKACVWNSHYNWN